MLHHEYWTPIYFKVKVEVKSHKKSRHGFLHSCECWFLLVQIMYFTITCLHVNSGFSGQPLLDGSRRFSSSAHFGKKPLGINSTVFTGGFPSFHPTNSVRARKEIQSRKYSIKPSLTTARFLMEATPALKDQHQCRLCTLLSHSICRVPLGVTELSQNDTVLRPGLAQIFNASLRSLTF